MYRNFAWGLANLTRPWTIITSCFSHADLTHMGVNLLSFYFMGQAALSILTTSQFAMLYLVAGTVGNIAQLLWRPFARDGVTPSFSLGASGATSGGTLVSQPISRPRNSADHRSFRVLQSSLSTELLFHITSFYFSSLCRHRRGYVDML